MERNLIQMPEDDVFLIALDIEQVPAEHVIGELFAIGNHKYRPDKKKNS